MNLTTTAIQQRVISFFCLCASTCLWGGCGPKPGTPEHVLQQLEEGHVVGAENLELLTLEHLEPMLALIDNPEVERIAKQQLIIRATSLSPDSPLEQLGGYLGHEEPDVRLHMIRWMATLENPQVIDRFIDQLIQEPEEIVRVKLAKALTTARSRSAVDTSRVATRLIENLAVAKPRRKKELLLSLGGYPTADAIKTIEKYLQSENLALAGSAGRAVVVVSAEQFDAVADLIEEMLDHGHSDIRRNGLRILWSQVRQPNADACRSELPIGVTSRAEPIATSLDALKANTEIHESEKKLAEQIRDCLPLQAAKPPEPASR